MSLAKVLRLEDYRGKRTQRLRLADALHRADPNRLAVFRFLTEVADLCEADRAATVWVDEYGPGAVHPSIVLDHLADRPRRLFSSEPLRRAWELGVPAAVDAMPAPGSTIPPMFAISLGSDGMRAWFIVAESAAGRPLLTAEVRDRIMFLAGECAAIILHQELDRLLPGNAESSEAGFAGWPILKDLEGRETDEEEGRRIAQRFVVARVARMFAEEDFVFSDERMSEQVRRARAELPDRGSTLDPEAELWHRTLDALEDGDLTALADTLVRLGETVERRQHTHGALELYECAFEVATAVSLPRSAAAAAWYSGRVLRRHAVRDRAREWYLTAQRIADVADLGDVAVHVQVGLALMARDLGNIPAARVTLDEALEMAERLGEAEVVAVVHHSFLGLEQVAGNIVKGLEHGWIAVATYEGRERRNQVMASLAGALMQYGDREAAEDAWTLVAHESTDRHYQIYANDALAHLAALRGDGRAFELYASRCDALNWESGSQSVKAEILHYRGLSHRALGRLDLADSWLRRAVAFAEEHGFNRVLFEAEAALDALREAAEATPVRREEPAPTAPASLREGLRAMRRELVGVGT